ncbi:MAG: MFS transporter, partial [Polyangiales bacterium]
MTTTTQPGRTRAFALSWLSYASYYLGRKGFSVVKVAIAREHGLATSTLALIDSVYLVAYASGQLPSGLATDRLGARRVLALGLFASAAACAAFGASNNAAAFAVCFALNGLAQSTGWPASTKVMAEWSEPHNRGRIMGVWGTCYQVGGIAATALAAWALARYGWRAAFQLPACWLAGMGGVVLLWLRERRVVSPSDAPQPTAADD